MASISISISLAERHWRVEGEEGEEMMKRGSCSPECQHLNLNPAIGSQASLFHSTLP